MRLFDLLTLVSGVASVVSLLLTLWERFSSWRRFIAPVAWGLAGFTAGRMSIGTEHALAPSTTPGFPSTETLLFLSLLGVICFGAFALLRRNEPIWAYMLFSLGLSSAGPAFLKSYADLSRRIPTEDLVVLSNEKERVGDLSGAIIYTDRALKATDDGALRSKLEARKANLQTKLVDEASTKPTASP